MKTLEERKTYWLTQLSDVPAVLALPSDRERPPVSSFLRETVSLALVPDLCLKLKAWAADEAMSVSSVLMAAFASVLSRYTGQSDIVIRKFAGLEPNAQGKLVLSFVPVDGYASVAGIEVLPL